MESTADMKSTSQPTLVYGVIIYIYMYIYIYGKIVDVGKSDLMRIIGGKVNKPKHWQRI